MFKREDLRIPRDYSIWAGADTGTYMGGAIAAISPDYHAYILEEFPNYRYTGDGTIEETGETVSEWIKRFATSLKYWTGERRVSAWVDANTTFKTEVGHGLSFRMNKRHLELRTEITREYLRNGRLHLMPWLTVIPKEMEWAKFPEKESAGSGRNVRIKHKDHCLDGVEHILSRRPHPDTSDRSPGKVRAIQAFVDKHKRPDTKPTGDPHMGAL